MNLVFGLVLSAGYFGLIKWGPSDAMKFATILSNLILMNVGLAFFNLLPCPPLDGGALLVNLLPRRLSHWGEAAERYGSILLFMLLMSGLLGYYMLPARIAGAIWIGFLTRLGIG
jgi:Zn-dependent protease